MLHDLLNVHIRLHALHNIYAFVVPPAHRSEHLMTSMTMVELTDIAEGYNATVTVLSKDGVP
jgi:hypothetical protein